MPHAMRCGSTKSKTGVQRVVTLSHIDVSGSGDLVEARCAGAMGAWVEEAIAAAPNKDLLQHRLDSIGSDDALVCFLHRFVLFNDALAARVPFLAGVIHLTPNLFIDRDADEDFCRQSNGRIAAFVAEAANDEYNMKDGENLVHQYLSQLFLRGALAHCGVNGQAFDREHPLPARLAALLEEARGKFLLERGPEQIFSALGFHVGLEFFAHQEFNLVDAWLRGRYPALVASLEHGGGGLSDYRWLKIHTIVEIDHYRAGVEALEAALAYYHRRDEMPRMLACIKDGFAQFVDLQRRYYEAILCDVA
jgi:hypothetical protein